RGVWHENAVESRLTHFAVKAMRFTHDATRHNERLELLTVSEVCSILRCHEKIMYQCPAGRFRLSLAPERIAFMVRCSNISGMACWTPTTGSPISTIFGNLKSAKMISAVSSVAPFLKIKHSSFSPTRGCGCVSQSLRKR